MDISKKQKVRKEDVNVVDTLSKKQLIRWYALCEAIDIIESGSNLYNISFDTIQIKSNHIQEYIDITSDIITNKIKDGHNV